MWHLENGVALSSERKLVTVSNEAIKIDHLGKSSFSVFNLPAGLRFNDDVYFFMSQRLLDTQMIQTIQSRNFNDDSVIAPSFLVQQTKSIKAFRELYATALVNLCENRVPSVPFLTELTEGVTVESAEWLITDENISEEIDRNEGMNVSFNFALCWLRTEQTEIL